MLLPRRLGLPLFGAILLLGTGCLSVKRQYEALPRAGASPLRVSSDVERELSTDYFQLVFVTFENRTADWIRVRRVDIVPSENFTTGAVRVTTGAELAAWGAAVERRAHIRTFNMQSFLFWSGVATDVAAGVGTGAPVGGTETGMLGAVLTSETNREYVQGKRTPLVPDGHLLAGEILVPPGLHADRWLLLNTRKRGELPEALTLKLTLDSGAETTLDLSVNPRLTARR